jgi:uroporphyrinogen-III decarboxylase
MRQAGRYMAAFREYSDKYPFRMRSETPEIAIELSLQVCPCDLGLCSSVGA